MTARLTFLLIVAVFVTIICLGVGVSLVQIMLYGWETLPAHRWLFTFLLTVADLWLGTVIVKKLVTKVGNESFVEDKVGMLPHDLPKWKWERVSTPIACEVLSSYAQQISILCAQEEELMKDPRPNAKKLLDLNKGIILAKKRFWEGEKAFRYCGVPLDKKNESWKDYL